MKSTLYGVLVGAIFAITVYATFLRSAEPDSSRPNASVNSILRSNQAQSVTPQTQIVTPGESSTTQTQSSPRSGTIWETPLKGIPTEELERIVAASDWMRGGTPNGGGSPNSAEPLINAEPLVANGLPGEFGWVTQSSVERHFQVQAEEIDPNWTPVIEMQLREYFAVPHEALANYEYPVITCGSTQCELAFVSRTLPELSPTESDRPNQAAINTGTRVRSLRNALLNAGFFQEESWSSEFEFNPGFTPAIGNYDNGVTSILFFLERSTSE
jgi:hypothetical protein